VSTAGAARAERQGSEAATRPGTDDAGTPSRGALLVALLGGPAAWTTHLLAANALVGYACSESWGGVRVALVVLTVVALAGAVASGLLSRRLWMRARAVDRPTDDRWDARMGERTARVSFLMVMGLVMAALFALGIAYQAAPVLLAQTCAPTASQ